MEVCGLTGHINRTRLIGSYACGNHIFCATEVHIRLLSVANHGLVAETLLVMLARCVIAAMGVKVRFVITGEVHIHITLRVTTNAEEKEKLLVITYGDCIYSFLFFG